MMKKLFSTGQLINQVGFGTWQLGGETTFGGKVTGWGSVDYVEAEKAILLAIDKGITFFDTADTYGKGKSEEFLGKVIGNNQNIVICTKFGNREDNNGFAYQDFSEKWLIQSVDDSLHRLKRDSIDILLFHSPPDDFEWSTYDKVPLDKLIKSGKIKTYGVSCKSVAGAVNVLKHKFGFVIEAIYNLLDRRVEGLVLDECLNNKIDFIARVPLASGYLSARTLNREVVFQSNDYRYSFPSELNDWFAESTKKVSFLNDLEGGLSTSAIRFCISNPSVTVAIPGLKKVKYVEDAYLALHKGELEKDDIAKIKMLLPGFFPGWN